MRALIVSLSDVTTAPVKFIHSLKAVNVVSSEEAVEVDGVFSTSGNRAHVLLPLADHGPLQQAGALQGQL